MRQIMDLWAFAVAHPGRAELAANEDDFKAKLLAALPLFDRLSEGGEIRKFSAATPLGSVALADIKAALAMSGIAQDGNLTWDLSFGALSIPDGLLPSWARGLVPKAFDLHLEVNGANLDAPARALIGALHLAGAGTPVSEADAKRFAEMFQANTIRVALRPSGFSVGDLDARIEGGLIFHGGPPSVNATVKATGLRKLLAQLQDAARSDKTATGLYTALTVADQLAKTADDGSQSWVVEKPSIGPMSVNGTPFGPAK